MGDDAQEERGAGGNVEGDGAMTDASDTPRTDTEEAMYSLSSVNSWGMGGWDFARTLERELAAKSAEVERLRADARRFQWLEERFYGIDFAYMDADDRRHSVLVFKMEDNHRQSADLGASIDAALEAK